MEQQLRVSSNRQAVLDDLIGRYGGVSSYGQHRTRMGGQCLIGAGSKPTRVACEGDRLSEAGVTEPVSAFRARAAGHVLAERRGIGMTGVKGLFREHRTRPGDGRTDLAGSVYGRRAPCSVFGSVWC
jgi:hypothetical protein